MAVTIYLKNDIIWCKSEGNYQFEDLVDEINNFLAGLQDSDDYRENKSWPILLDATDSEVNRSLEQYKIARAMLLKNKHLLDNRFAIILSKKRLHHFGLARMMTMLLEDIGITIEIFYDRESALEWLKPSEK